MYIPQKGNHGNYVTGKFVRAETMATALQNNSQTGNHDNCVTGTSLRKKTTATYLQEHFSGWKPWQPFYGINPKIRNHDNCITGTFLRQDTMEIAMQRTCIIEQLSEWKPWQQHYRIFHHGNYVTGKSVRPETMPTA